MDSKVLFFEPSQDKIRCRVCPHNCLIGEGQFGACRVRAVKDGQLIAVNFGEVTSAAVDPIEKKPLYHFKPSMDVLSLGSYGCNMTCSFCQNYEISQSKPATEFMSIERLIEVIPTIENNVGVAFTYNEPLMWYEYILEASQKIKQHNKDTSVIVVTNGYINKEPLMKLLPYVDAMNIDLKGYTNRFYNKVCGATLEPVLETIKRCSGKCHIEITTLLVSDENDSLEEVKEIAGFLSEVDENIPLHLSRYFPRYKMNNEATKVEKMLLAQQEAQKFLKYVYVGNVGGIDSNTYCPQCGALLIRRSGYNTEVVFKGNKCSICHEKVNIIF